MQRTLNVNQFMAWEDAHDQIEHLATGLQWAPPHKSRGNLTPRKFAFEKPRATLLLAEEEKGGGGPAGIAKHDGAVARGVVR